MSEFIEIITIFMFFILIVFFNLSEKFVNLKYFIYTFEVIWRSIKIIFSGGKGKKNNILVFIFNSFFHITFIVYFNDFKKYNL